MPNYLDEAGLSTLWSKIASTYATKASVPSVANYIPYGGVLMPTNPFGGKQLYINHTDNAFASADKKFYVTITKHSVSSGGVNYPYADTSKEITADDYFVDGPILSTLTETANRIFDGSYETNISCASGEYLKIHIMFGSNTSPSASSKYFEGYPYGTFYLSFYHNCTPDRASQLRVYNKFAAHTVGWHLYNSTQFAGSLGSNTASVIQQIADSNDYQRTCVEFIIFGSTTSGRSTNVTQIDYRLSRPNLSRDGSTVTKYGNQTLYWNFTWNENHQNTVTVGPSGIWTPDIFLTGNSIKRSSSLDSTTASYSYTLPNKSGTLALTSDIPSNFVKYDTNSQGLTDTQKSNARTNIGLGTAATANTGTSSGNVPVLDTNGKLSTSVLPTIPTSTSQLTNDSDFVAGAGLTADTIILGSGANGVKTSSKTISTSLDSSDSKVPTSKAVSTAITNAVNAKIDTFVIDLSDSDWSNLDNVFMTQFKVAMNAQSDFDYETTDSSTIYFDTVSGTKTLSALKIGDVLLVKQTNKPDYWYGGFDAPATFGDPNVYHFYKLETQKIDLNGYQPAGNYVTYTSGTATVAGTSKTTYTYGETAIYAPNGLIMGGTASAAGLVTRGICGVSVPTNNGACTKENLYINYDSTNTYSSSRQLIIQAGEVGTHYGNNLYQYAAARGDAVKNWVEAQGYVTSSGVTSVATSGTGLSGGTITTSGTITLDSSSAGNAAANKVVIRNAAGTIQTEAVAMSSGSTTKCTMRYDAENDCVKFVF